MNKLCAIRDICRIIGDYENGFCKAYSLCLNEGMVLCSLKEGKLSSGEIASRLGLSCSNTSKLLRSLEEKKFIERDMGEKDKRQMYFTLTIDGIMVSERILKEDMPVSEKLTAILSYFSERESH